MMERVNTLKGYFGLRSVNENLALENAQLRARLSDIQVQITNRVDSMLDTTTQQRFVLHPALIINNSIERSNNMITINKGSIHGITKYSTVIEYNGIIGFVTQVGKKYSTVMSILNTNARVSVKSKRTNSIGNLVWDGRNPLEVSIEAIPKHVDIKAGDTLVTTGFSHFPMNHPVALITKAFVAPGENFYNIEAKLFNDISKSQYVYVVEDLHRIEIDSLQISNK
jgi:rod shape-determining protein MreC